MSARILVVDDDTALAEMIGIVLHGEGFEPSFCADGALALDAFHSVKPDLVLLDLMLPGLDGIEVCRLIRAESGTPIIMLTAKSDTTDDVKGLESGADDYMVKPFNPKELVARIRTRLRPTPAGTSVNLQIGDLVVDAAAHLVARGVDDEVPDLQVHGCPRRGRAQARPDPGHQFLGVERLDHVVVGAGFEALDDICGVGLRGQHDDGRSGLGA